MRNLINTTRLLISLVALTLLIPAVSAQDTDMSAENAALFTIVDGIDNIGGPNATAISSNGFISVGGADGRLRIWERNFDTLHRVMGHDNGVLSVRFGPFGSTLFSTDTAGTLFRWDIESGGQTHRANNSGSSPQGAIITDITAAQVATFDFNGTFTLWDGATLEVLQTETGSAFALPHLQSDVLARTPAETTNIIEVRTLSSGDPLWQVTLDDATYAEPVAFNNDGTRLMVTANDGFNRIYDTATGDELYTIEIRGFGLAKFSPNDEIIAEGGENGNLHIWDAADGFARAAIPGHAGPINEITFSPDSTQILSIGADGFAYLWALSDLAGVAPPQPTVTPVPPAATNTPEAAAVVEPTGTPLPDGFPPVTQAEVQVAEQVFENGRMFWVQPVNQIWVMILTDEGRGQWIVYQDNFDPTVDSDTDPQIEAPDGLIQPERGFGKLWRENPELREALGWAITPEFGYVSEYTYVPGGELVNGEYVPGPGYHILFSLNSEAFRFNEADSTWQLN